MTSRPYMRLVSFEVHRRAFFLIGLGAASLFLANTGAALWFSQKAEINGVRIETDRKVYSIGDTVLIRLFLVNNQDHTMSACVNGHEATLSDVFGVLDGFRVRVTGGCSQRVLLLRPGSEVLIEEGIHFLLALRTGVCHGRCIPGPYSIEARVLTLNDTTSSFTGSISIFVVLGPHL